jgi:exonuclease III
MSETWTMSTKLLQNWIKFSAIGRTHSIITDSEIHNNNPVPGKGTALIISRSLRIFQQSIITVPQRMTGITLNIKGIPITIISIYVPTQNESNLAEIEILHRKLTNYVNNAPPNSQTVIIGDWNAVPNPSIDRVLSSSENDN